MIGNCYYKQLVWQKYWIFYLINIGEQEGWIEDGVIDSAWNLLLGEFGEHFSSTLLVKKIVI